MTETPRFETGLLLLADISGYTSFLENVAAAHPEMSRGTVVPPAYSIITTLLDVIVDRIAPTFRLSEVEGDAVFAYADDRVDGTSFLELIRSTYRGFRDRVEEAQILQGHECEACVVLTSLELKFLVHQGQFVINQVAGRTRLLSPAVNLAHRLLKNSVTERTGLRAYVLVTDAAVAELGLSAEAGVGHQERYSDAGAVSCQIIGLP